MVNWPALIVFLAFFLLVTVLGFVAAGWRRGNLDLLDEWGLAGRRFGTLISWFLLGGDLYTAYTFIAVPALVFGQGAMGFFAMPYTIIAYPMIFVFMPRLWQVSRKHGYITPADFVRGRYDSSLLALAVALTGILATMPYIALQLVGIQVVIAAMGVTGKGLMADMPLIIAFVILAAYTYTSGLRAPAMISVVKDLLIYITVLAAVIIIPIQLGGYGKIFALAGQALPKHSPPGNLILSPKLYPAYASMALGSAMALFLYPHVITGVLSSKSGKVIKRNAALLPAYSFLLGLLALLGYLALASGVSGMKEYSAGFKQYQGQFAIPALFLHQFPGWFVGFAFAAIGIGALVPAAIMSIAAANLFTRNIYREFFRPECSNREEATTAKIMSLLVKLGALVFIILIPSKFAIYLQLLGGVWILQTFPAVIVGLYTRWLHRYALLAGWAVGMS
ncbi:MAG: sodium:solute symporter, partial [Armatimonadota bacterium]|nr:sodium:solute symporter [Armatimonadota bacterium]